MAVQREGCMEERREAQNRSIGGFARIVAMGAQEIRG